MCAGVVFSILILSAFLQFLVWSQKRSDVAPAVIDKRGQHVDMMCGRTRKAGGESVRGWKKASIELYDGKGALQARKSLRCAPSQIHPVAWWMVCGDPDSNSVGWKW